MAAIRCIPNVYGGGEGFLAVTPDGTQYRFDRLVSRDYPQLSKPGPSPELLQAGKAVAQASTLRAPGGPQPNVQFGYNLNRQEVWILPSLVTDRYGNAVTYTYNPAAPWQLTRIEASDGRVLVLTYTNNVVTSVFDGTRTWTYTYGSDTAGTTLTTVTQPDSATWQFSMGVFTRGEPLGGSDNSCDGSVTTGSAPETGSMTHPSGAVGSFTVDAVLHGRSFVTRECRGSSADGTYPVYPRYIASRSLINKTISGQSLPAIAWNYSYSPVGATASWSTCSGNCPETKTTDVTDSRGVLTRYTFGNRFRVTEGQLQKVEVGTAAGGFLRTTTTLPLAS